MGVGAAVAGIGGAVLSSRADSKNRRAQRRENSLQRGLQREAYEASEFRPVGVTTSMGNVSYSDRNGYSVDTGTFGLQNQLLNDATGLFAQAGQDPNVRAAEIAAQQTALLEPEMQRQQVALKENLFGSGRLGLMMNGTAAGAGGGMVNPDVFGYQQALGQTLAGIQANARNQSLQEQGALANIGQGLLANQQNLGAREIDLINLANNLAATESSAQVARGSLLTGGGPMPIATNNNTAGKALTGIATGLASNPNFSMGSIFGGGGGEE